MEVKNAASTDIFEGKKLDVKKFPEHLLKTVLCKILSIQVNGDLKFMGNFESPELGITLGILFSAAPKHNGGVEWGNRVLYWEFRADSNFYVQTLLERCDLSIAESHKKT